LWCRNGKAFCEGPFTLHRQQLENYMQNVDVAPLEKCLRTPMISTFNFKKTCSRKAMEWGLC